MPYELYSHDAEQAEIAQRERLYWLTLLFGIGTIAALALHSIDADAYLLVLILGLMFHAGYAFAYLRDVITSTVSR